MTSFNRQSRELSSINPADPFSEDGWKYCSAKSLRGHIVNAHFQARTLADIGVPLYDIEIAEVRNIGLGWVVRRAFEKIIQKDESIQAEIENHRVTNDLDVPEYRLRLVKSIRTIADKRLAIVPWDKIDAAYPDASQVPVDLTVDTTDTSFKSMIWDRRKSMHAFKTETMPDESFEKALLLSAAGNLMLPADPAYTVNI